MTSPLVSIAVRDLESGHKILRSPVPSSWLQSILQDTELTPWGSTEGEISLTLSKNGREILVRGRLDVTVSLPCSRTLDPAVYRLQPEIFLMLHPSHEKPSGGGRKRAGARSLSSAGPAVAHKKTGSNQGKSAKTGASGKKSSWEDDPELLEEDAFSDTYSGDTLLLDPFLREFILLEVPMVPLREDLRSSGDEASPSPPGGLTALGLPDSPHSVESSEGKKPLDPRLSPLAELKARLEKQKE